MDQDKEVKLIEYIRSGKFSKKELKKFYENAEIKKSTAIMEAVKLKMRADFPRAANSMFGAKGCEAMALLEDVLNRLSSKYDLAGNRVKNHVKTGGDRLKGEKYISCHISYKNSHRVAAGLELIQDSSESELTATVTYYKTGRGRFRDSYVFQMHDFNLAVETYEALLIKVLACEQDAQPLVVGDLAKNIAIEQDKQA